MIKTDRKMIKNILRLTKDLNTNIAISDDCRQLLKMNNQNDVSGYIVIKGIRPEFVEPSIFRLIDNGYLKYSKKYWGGFYFSITDKILLRREIFMEAFTKKFWGGFVVGILSGIITTVIAGLLLSCLQALLGI